MKLLKKIVSVDDGRVLQLEIDRLQNWCQENKLALNARKCAIMSITRKAPENVIRYKYKIGCDEVSRVESKRDLGVIIDSKFSFDEHINVMTRKAYQMLGFIFRCGKYFRNRMSLTLLFNALVRNRLEYCSSVWNPQYVSEIDIIERVQKKFTRMLYFKFKLQYPRPNYNVRLQTLKMHSLESRRLENDEITLFKIIHNYIDSRSLKQSLCFHQPSRDTRRNQVTSSDSRRSEHQNQIFYLPKMSTNYQANAPMNRIQKNHDVYFSPVNIFNSSFSSFKKEVRQYFEF